MNKYKKFFPFFQNNPKLIYFDSAATTQKTKTVIDSMYDFYNKDYATVHRGVYQKSMHATDLYDATRTKAKEFLNANREEEIIFTRGTTDGINLVAWSLFQDYINEGDEIITTEMEHHSNFVPWQIIAKLKKAKLKIIPMNENAELDLQQYKKLLSDKTKIVCVGHMANSTGTINPIKEIIDLAHSKKALCLVDGAQSTAHMKIDVKELDVDFYAFSGHKIYGPTGIGILYGKYELLDMMPPLQGGGDMIERVELDSTTYQKPPLKFEAGTPSIAEVIGLKPAFDFLDEIGRENIFEYEKKLLDYATEKFKQIDKLKIIGNAKEKGALISFVIENIHPLDLGSLLDTHHVALRTGHHCAQPTMHKFNISGTARISFGIYNDLEEIDQFFDHLKFVIKELS